MARYTILVIDDQWSMQEYARVVLQAVGYRVLLAEDGVTGLSLARTEHPHVIVMDLCLPDMETVELLRRLRQDSPTARIPVILITLAASEETLTACLQAGAAGYLCKPFPPPALAQMVERALHLQEFPVAV